ncbi:hypothetical protein TRFO_34163 [Tritrichomonas foetus]|uniref:Uncharacterized protein n=1 Tax=Tritrichomonas foetus TaxID=1144522 RepID=A0A1J4JLV0_9EUKA|nr:hypothetical protein TRFO_34163 [Tritrichomonas foetus]|eukprot:OHS99391.1 hypothetical protein TRFO_34163 [Tritrichomonas foetus]
MTGLPNFRLNLSDIQKKVNSPNKVAPPDDISDKPPENTHNDVKRNQTIQPRQRPGQGQSLRGTTTLARKNLVIQSSSDESDFDLDLESIPVGKEVVEEPKDEVPDEVEAPVVQVSQLPELDVEDDDELQIHGQGNKLAILYDLLLGPDQVEEPPEEWSYRQFIKQFANSEASQENVDDDGDEYEIYDDDEESEDEDYDND